MKKLSNDNRYCVLEDKGDIDGNEDKYDEYLDDSSTDDENESDEEQKCNGMVKEEIKEKDISRSNSIEYDSDAKENNERSTMEIKK